jgi:hypothetical protein
MFRAEVKEIIEVDGCSGFLDFCRCLIYKIKVDLRAFVDYDFIIEVILFTGYTGRIPNRLIAKNVK